MKLPALGNYDTPTYRPTNRQTERPGHREDSLQINSFKTIIFRRKTQHTYSILYHQVDIGQVEGSFVMGLGLWTSEEIKFNPENGQILTYNTWVGNYNTWVGNYITWVGKYMYNECSIR